PACARAWGRSRRGLRWSGWRRNRRERTSASTACPSATRRATSRCRRAGMKWRGDFPGPRARGRRTPRGCGGPLRLPCTNKTRSGRLAVRTTPDGADVVVDGENVGTAPVEIEISAGRHRVGARMRGYRTNTQMIDIPDGDTAQWAPELIPLGQRAGQLP